MPDLIERSNIERTLHDALLVGRAEGGSIAFLNGTPGIGKTSMLSWAMARAQEDGFLVAEGVASRMERSLPFGLLGQVIVALGGNPVEDVAELALAGGQSARFYRTLRWLSELSESRPVMIALDDLHWADPDSLALLGFLCRRLTGLRVCVVGTLRPEPPQAYDLAQELASTGSASLSTLEPLSREGAVDLLSRTLDRTPDREEAVELWRACAGTPLLLEAAGRALSEGTPLHQLETGPIGDSALLLRRFADVGSQEFDYVKAGAIFGVHFDHSKATALSGVPLNTADGALVALVRAGVLEDRGSGSVSFVHPLFVQALLDAQPSVIRARQHAAAFTLVVAEHGADALAAEHAALAEMIGDPVAVEITSRAGRAALAQGALAAAATHLGNAVRLAGRDPPVELMLLLGQALVAQAQIEPARALCAELLARDLDDLSRSQALRLSARVEALASRPAAAQELFVQAAAVAPGGGGRVEVLCDALLTCLAIAPAEWVLELAGEALAIAEPGSPQQRLLRFIESYAALLCRCDPQGAMPVIEEVIRLGARAVWPGQGWNLTLAVHALNMSKVLENFDGARVIFEHEYAEAVSAGAPVLMSALAVAYADVLLRLGRLDEATELVESTSALIDRPIRPWYDLAAAVLYSELGQDERSRTHIETLRSFQAEIPAQQYAVVSLWLHLLDARGALAAGSPEQASDTMLRAGEIAKLGGRVEPCLVPWAGTALEAHLAAGRIERARELLTDLESRAATLPSGWPRAVITLGYAGIAALECSHERAIEHFEEAIERFGQLSQPLELARALISYGTYLRRNGRPRDAREPLARALVICEQAHAERLGRAAHAELAASGGRRRRRGEDDSMLTAQERRVAALAAEGLANGQIAAALYLSPKTVGFHLQRVYAKLDIHSRRELIRRAAEFPSEP
jgi:DNA-binding CsgD family transcriptional regulator/tetratricopeptide (TPR) repeat protein